MNNISNGKVLFNRIKPAQYHTFKIRIAVNCRSQWMRANLRRSSALCSNTLADSNGNKFFAADHCSALEVYAEELFSQK